MNRKTIIVLCVLLVSSSVGAGVASATPTNTTTNTTESTTDQPTTTKTPTESVEEQVADGVREGISEATSGDSESTTEKSSSNCLKVAVETGNTTTTECVPKFHHKIDKSTTILAVDWSSDVTTIVIDSERPQRVSIVDTHSIKSSGAGDVNYVEETLSSGRNVIRIRATESSGDKTLTVGTSGDLDYISDPSEPFLSGGLRTSLLYMSGIGGGLGTIAVMAVYVWIRMRKRSSGWTDVMEDYSP